jgi:hypothetical protein
VCEYGNKIKRVNVVMERKEKEKGLRVEERRV